MEKKDLYFGATFLGLNSLPLLKLVNEPIGPEFAFYFVFLWMPVVSLALSSLRGWKSGAIMLAALAFALGLTFLNYLKEPAMNFQRELLARGGGLMVLFIIGALFTQLIPKRQNTSAGEKAVLRTSRQ